MTDDNKKIIDLISNKDCTCTHGNDSKLCKQCGVSKTQEAIKVLKGHPVGFGGVTTAPKLFGPTPSTAFGVGNLAGHSIAANAPAGVAGQVQRVAGVGIGQMNPALANSPGKPSAGGSSGAPKAQKTNVAGGVGKSVEDDEDTKDVVEKSVSCGRIHVRPFTESKEYDSNAIYRSATQPTSRAYTSLAPVVRDTLKDVDSKEHERCMNNTNKNCVAHGYLYKSDNCPICTHLATENARTSFVK